MGTSLHYSAYQAKEIREFQKALDFLEEALSISSPLEELDDVPLIETKIAVLLEAGDDVKMAYLQIQNLLLLDADNEEFKEVIASEEFIALDYEALIKR